MRPSKPDLPQHLADAFRQTWPDDVIDMPADLDEAPFWNVYPKLKAGLSRIAGTAAMYERKPQEDRNRTMLQIPNRIRRTGMPNRVPIISSFCPSRTTASASRPTRSNPIKMASSAALRVKGGLPAL